MPDYNLFTYPQRPGFKEPTTSRDAAEKVEPAARTLRDQVRAAYRNAWPGGLTADEAAAKLGRSILSVRPRVTELRKTKLLIPAIVAGTQHALRRKNESGLDAVVLVAVRYGETES